jgi:two-component system LytT family response regulator
MLSAVIIDDEEVAVNLLVELLKHHTSIKIKIVGTATNLTNGVEIIKSTQPDIVFLDINMSGRNGLEIYNDFKTPNFKIIFCTAYQKYAIEVINKYAFGYILKPIGIIELNGVLNRLKKQLLEEQKQLQLEDKINILNSPVTSGENVILEVDNGFIIGNTRSIEYCYSKDAHTVVVMHSQKEYVIKKSIRQLQEILPENQFYQTHKSFLVNIYYICKFIRSNVNYVLMESGIKIPVSVRITSIFTKEIKKKMLA